MGFSLTSREFAEYLKRTAAKIAENKDYITELDAATGDGDHWANMNAGFSKLAADALGRSTDSSCLSSATSLS